MRLFLDALECKNTGRPPIWLMRQAGRYLPEYQKVRKNRKLYDMFHDVPTIVEVTCQPVDILGVDAAILFSDILTVLEGLGIRYDFKEGQGPVVHDPPSKIALNNFDYPHIQEATQRLRDRLSVPLVGFAGGPYTIARYILGGEKKTKQFLFRHPKEFAELLQTITTATLHYLQFQNVVAIQIFESWANDLSIYEFQQFSLPYLKQLVEGIDKPVILFSRGSSFFAQDLATAKPAGVSIDWSGSLKKVRQTLPPTIALQGNLDPMTLYGTQDQIALATDRILDEMRGDKGFIFNLGHGILPDIPAENVKFLVNYVQNRTV